MLEELLRGRVDTAHAEGRRAMSLADQVLALHSDIQEAFVLEDRGSEHVVVGEASRSGMTMLAD